MVRKSNKSIINTFDLCTDVICQALRRSFRHLGVPCTDIWNVMCSQDLLRRGFGNAEQHMNYMNLKVSLRDAASTNLRSRLERAYIALIK